PHGTRQGKRGASCSYARHRLRVCNLRRSAVQPQRFLSNPTQRLFSPSECAPHQRVIGAADGTSPSGFGWRRARPCRLRVRLDSFYAPRAKSARDVAQARKSLGSFCLVESNLRDRNLQVRRFDLERRNRFDELFVELRLQPQPVQKRDGLAMRAKSLVEVVG